MYEVLLGHELEKQQLQH